MPSGASKQKKKPSLQPEITSDLQPQLDAFTGHASTLVPKEEYESLKKKFQRQNQEVIRSNTILIIQLRDAQNQVKKVEAENLKLRTELNAAIQLIDDFEESHNDLHERLKKMYAENVRIRKDTLNNQRKKVQNLTSATTEIFTSLTQHLQSIAQNLESNVISAWLDLSDELIKDLDLTEDNPSSMKHSDCRLNQPQLNLEEAKMKRNEFHSIMTPCERKPTSKDVSRQRPAFKGKLDQISAAVAGQSIIEDEEDVSLDAEDPPAETSWPDLTQEQTAQSLKQDTQYHFASKIQPEMLEVSAARRAKTKPVNYALPSLRTKLRQNTSLETGQQSENLGLPNSGSAKDGKSDKSMISSQTVASQGEKHSRLNLSSSPRIPFSPKSTNIMTTSKLSQPKTLDAEVKSNCKLKLRKGGKLGTNKRRNSDG